MRRQPLKKTLPVLAVVGGLMFMATVVISAGHPQAFLIDTGETRPAVQATLDELQALKPPSIDDPAFRQAVEQLTQARYVSTVWLFGPDGRKVYSAGSTSAFGRTLTARQLASIDVRGVLDTVPQQELDAEQRLMLLAASAIRAEWEHNDLCRHLLYPIRDPQGTTVGLVGVSYDVSRHAHSGISPIFLALGALARLGGFVLYWLALPLWVLLDARGRGDRAWPWATFVFLGNLVALIAYLLARSPQPGAAPAA